MRDGSRVAVGSQQIKLASIAYLWVQSEHSGYVVVPASRPAGAAVHVMRPAAQSSDPKPGPTLAIQIARAQRFNRAALSVASCPCTTRKKPRPRRHGWDDDVVEGPRYSRSLAVRPFSQRERAATDRALTLGRLDENQLPAVQHLRDRTSLLDLRIRVPNRVMQGLDMDARNLHDVVIPRIPHRHSRAAPISSG